MANTTLLDNIIHELTELITNLYEFLRRTEASPERADWNEQLEQYIKKTLRVRLLAGQGDRIGLHDVCMQQQEYLRGLLTRDVAPTPQEWERLERWPLLLLSCLTTPVIEEAVDELIAHARSNTALSEHDARTLRSNLLTPAHTPPVVHENNVVALPVMRTLPAQHPSVNTRPVASNAASVRYLLQHELLDTVAEYASVADLPATTAAEHAQALRLCADRIQLLGISAAGSDLIGVMDCCLLCHDALIKYLDAHHQLNSTGRERIKIWAGLLARYLDTPDRAEVVDALLNFYQHGHFVPAMSACEYASLREYLLLDATTPTASRIEIKAVPEERTPTAQIVAMPFLSRESQTHLEAQPSVVTEQSPVMLRVPASVIDDLLRLLNELEKYPELKYRDKLRDITRHLEEAVAVELRISPTAASMPALLVQSRAQVLAISSRSIERILYVGSGQVHVDGDHLQYHVGAETYDAYEVERLLHLPVDSQWPEHTDRPALLVRDSTGDLRAVFVEQVLASQDVIVKALDPYLPNILGIEGATLLGSGDIATVIDLPGLLQTARVP